MQDGPTPNSLNVWLEELLALNPWARGLTIDEKNEEFAAARQKATLARHAEGKEAWNVWADAILSLRSLLENKGQWYVGRENPKGGLEGQNDVTRAWLGMASAVFSTWPAPHVFEAEVSFAGFVFPSDTWFRNATFGGRTDFTGANFRDVVWFDEATFCGPAEFGGVVFGGVARFPRVTFRNVFWCGDATFRDLARFSGVAFHRIAHFERTTFHSEARFRGAAFDSAAWFEDAIFSEVPNFISSSFKGALRLDNVVTPRYYLLGYLLGYTSARDATARFRELRRRAAEAQDRDRELEFFAQESRTGRFHAKGLPSWVPKVWT